MSDTEPDSDNDPLDYDSSEEYDRETTAVAGPRADEYDPLELYEHQRHRNGDETVVLLLSFGDGFQVLAADIDAGGQLLEVEEIGDADSKTKAVGMAEYWTDAHPDGVLGGSDEDGFLTSLLGGGGT